MKLPVTIISFPHPAAVKGVDVAIKLLYTELHQGFYDLWGGTTNGDGGDTTAEQLEGVIVRTTTPSH